MKILLYLFLFLPLFSNNEPFHEKEKSNLRLSGKVYNYSDNFFIISYDTLGLGFNYNKDTIFINKDGSWKIDIPNFEYAQITFEINDRPKRYKISKFITDSLYIEIDFNIPDSVVAIGKQAPYFTFVIEQEKHWTKVFNKYIKRYPDWNKKKDSIHNILHYKIMDTTTIKRMEFVDSFFADMDIYNKETFINEEKNKLKYTNQFYKLSGANSNVVERLIFYREKHNLEDNLTPITFSDIEFSPQSLNISTYRDLMFDIWTKITRYEKQSINQDSILDMYLIHGLKNIEKFVKNDEALVKQKAVFISGMIDQCLVFNGKIDFILFQREIEKLRDNTFSNKYVSELDSKLYLAKDKFLKFSVGNKAPSFELYDINGNRYSNSDFIDKTVFIDVWTSWCGPCIKSFPKWNNIVNKFNNNENIFLSISLDERSEQFEKTIQKHSLSGLLFNLKEGTGSDFAKDYGIISFPTYIIIDNNGNIVQYKGSIDELLVYLGESMD